MEWEDLYEEYDQAEGCINFNTGNYHNGIEMPNLRDFF